jgi:hypothetical protein
MYFNTVGMRQYWAERRPVLIASFQRSMDQIAQFSPAERNMAEIASGGVGARGPAF